MFINGFCFDYQQLIESKVFFNPFGPCASDLRSDLTIQAKSLSSFFFGESSKQQRIDDTKYQLDYRRNDQISG
jgi:hypothetical protein